MISCDDTFLYKMSCSKSIAAYLSSKIDFFMMFQKSADKILEKHRKICSKRLFEKSQPNFEYKNYIYGSIILFDNFGDDNCEIELINTSNAHDREINN